MATPIVVPDEVPVDGTSLKTLHPDQLPSLIFGAGALNPAYNSDSYLLESDGPLRTVALALRYGIRAFDTSVYYGPSEIILGKALKALEGEFPRSSYQIMTKCGRFGADTFDYSPSRIRESVMTSLERMHTTYLDAVYLHDVEFVADQIIPRTTGNHLVALTDEAEKAKYGLAEGQEGVVHGEGDQRVLDAFNELRELQKEGIIKKIGITGYPLPTLLRIALLILHTPPYKPVDVLLSYSHFSLQNSSLLQFIPALHLRAQIPQIIAASPFSMGLLTDRGPPAWHPAPPKMVDCVHEARRDVLVNDNGNGMPALAMGFAVYKADRITVWEVKGVPLVAGFSTPEEVHEGMRAWREVIDAGDDDKERRRKEEATEAIFEREGYLNWSWAQPPE